MEKTEAAEPTNRAQDNNSVGSSHASSPSVIDSSLARGLRQFDARRARRRLHDSFHKALENPRLSMLDQLVRQGALLHKRRRPPKPNVKSGVDVLYVAFGGDH